jgi:hypothetical protein
VQHSKLLFEQCSKDDGDDDDDDDGNGVLDSQNGREEKSR